MEGAQWSVLHCTICQLACSLLQQPVSCMYTTNLLRHTNLMQLCTASAPPWHTNAPNTSCIKTYAVSLTHQNQPPHHYPQHLEYIHTKLEEPSSSSYCITTLPPLTHPSAQSPAQSHHAPQWARSCSAPAAQSSAQTAGHTPHPQVPSPALHHSPGTIHTSARSPCA